MLNLSVLLEDSARKFGDRNALVLGDRRMTYAEVDMAANRIAQLLASRGIQPGDKVALTCPNLPYFPIIYFGILKVGAVVVPLNILLKAREVAYHLDDADAKAYFCFEGTPELPLGVEGYAGFQQASDCEHFFVITAALEASTPIDGTETLGQALGGLGTTFEAVATEPTDTAAIIYTSGTTGEPKGAEISHANAAMNVTAMNRMLENKLADDTHVVALPLFHAFGTTMHMLAGFSMAATLVLVPRFDARQILTIMENERVTFFAGVPTMWWGLLRCLGQDVDIDRIAQNLRIGVSGGASLSVDIINQVKEQLGVTILEGYGLSETTAVATFNQPDRAPKTGSIGTPVWGVDCKLINDDWSEVTEVGEVGEMAIRGHNVMKGYYKRSAATAEVIKDGWFRSGDLARKDADGFYYIVDRSKDVIIRGGHNVYPRELEEVLMTHQAVSLAAVIGTPHEGLGEEIKAVIVRADGSDITEAEMIAWAKEQMAANKYPRIVEFVDSLPMTATGKILKRELA